MTAPWFIHPISILRTLMFLFRNSQIIKNRHYRWWKVKSSAILTVCWLSHINGHIPLFISSLFSPCFLYTIASPENHLRTFWKALTKNTSKSIVHSSPYIFPDRWDDVKDRFGGLTGPLIASKRAAHVACPKNISSSLCQRRTYVYTMYNLSTLQLICKD